MELAEIIATLRRIPVLVALVALVAIGAGVLAGYRVGGFPPTLEPRVTSLGVASKQVVLDGWRSPMLDLKFDTEPLAARSGALAQVLASPALVHETARVAGVPEREITSEGPFVGPAAPWNVVVPSEARGNQVTAEHRVYRLSFVTRLDVPVVTIHAQGPSPEAAALLAESAYTALSSYLAELAGELPVAPPRPVVLRDMGPAAAGVVPEAVGKVAIVLAFGGTLLLGLLGLLSVEALRRRLHNARAVAVRW